MPGVFTRCDEDPQDRKIPIYIAGGFSTKLFVQSFAEQFVQTYNAQITYSWWNKPQGFAKKQAISELEALRYSEVLIVLDKGAKVGTSFEMGYFMGINRGTHCYWVHEKSDQTLDWFASVLPYMGDCPELISVGAKEWETSLLVRLFGELKHG